MYSIITRDSDYIYFIRHLCNDILFIKKLLTRVLIFTLAMREKSEEIVRRQLKTADIRIASHPLFISVISRKNIILKVVILFLHIAVHKKKLMSNLGDLEF